VGGGVKQSECEIDLSPPWFRFKDSCAFRHDKNQNSLYILQVFINLAILKTGIGIHKPT
jgi:hypothetical protein